MSQIAVRLYSVVMVRNLSNQLDRSADYSSYDDKSRIESADTGSYDDKSRIESAEELEEINTIEKQKVKEFELLEVSDKDAELVHEEGYDETINSNENIVAENNELIVEILLPEKTLTNNNIENERANLESKKEIVKDKCEVDKTCEENTHLEKESDHNNTENIASENDELNEKIPIENLETDDDNREETVNDTGEEVLEKDDQYEDSSESYTVISGQNSHSEDVNIGVYDENQKKKFVAQDMNESFHKHCPIQVETKNNNNTDLKYGRTRLEELEEIMEDWINYNFKEHESEEEYWFAQEKMIKIQEEKQVSLEEWNTIWMMFAAKQRRLEELEESEIEIEEIEEENELRRNLQNDGVGAKNLQVEKSVYFMDYEIFTLEVPVRKHGKPEIVKADSTEIQKDCIKKDRELEIESNRGKQAPCADTYLMRETAKERNINWCEEYKLNKIILVNYTERGKQLINIGLRNKYQKQGGQINVKGRENPLTGVRKIGVVQY